MSRILRARALSALFGLVGIGSLGSSPANAANYVYDVDFAVSNIRCSYFTTYQLCSTGTGLPGGPQYAEVGDTFSVRIDFDRPMQVPTSPGASAVQVLLADATAYPGGLTTGPYQSSSVITLEGFSGPAMNVEQPYAGSGNFGYDAITGFCCDEPAPSYSMTGINAEFTILGEGPRPLVGLIAGFLVALPSAPVTLANFQGGDADTPVALPAGLIGQVTGNIAGEFPPTSFYSFDWHGGIFQTQALLVGAEADASFQFKLFDSANNLIENVALNAGNNFDGLMTIGALNAGSYRIGLMTSALPDPQFTLNFLTPVGGTAAVPEPSTWALMLLGFAWIGAALRRAKRRDRQSLYARAS